MVLEREKFVDESWKDTALKHKDILKKSDTKVAGPSKLHIKAPFDRKEEVPMPPKPQAAPIPPQEQFQEDDNEQDSDSTHDKEEGDNPSEVNFLNYVSSLAFQSLIFMGQIPHPATNEIEMSLDQSKLMIDTLVMLREKTKGNLNKQEENMLNATVYELQMKFVEISRRSN